jgi:hypothetical protein
VRAFLVVAVAASALTAGCFSGNDSESSTGAAPGAGSAERVAQAVTAESLHVHLAAL